METPRSAFKSPWYRNSPGDVMDMDSPLATPIAPLQSAELRDARETVDQQLREINKLRAQVERLTSYNQSLVDTSQQKDIQIQKLIDDRARTAMELASVQRKFEDISIKSEHQIKQLEMQADHDRARLSTAMTQLSARVAAEEKIRNEFRALDVTSGQMRRELESELEKARQERDLFKRKFEQLSQEMIAFRTESHGHSSLVNEQLKLAQQRISDLESQLSQSKKRGFESMEVASQVDELKNYIQQQQLTIQRLESEAASGGASSFSSAASAAHVARISQLEQQLRDMSDQLRIYKKKAEDAEAAKENAKMLQNTVNQLQRLEVEASRLRVENDQLLKERSNWEGFLSGLPGFESVDEVKRNLSDMQHQNLALLDNNGKLTIELKRLSRIVEERDVEVKQLSEKLVSAQEKADDALRSLEFSNTRLRESERRMKSFEEILQSYRMEDSLPMHNFDAAKQAQLRELERQIGEKNQSIAKLENEMDGLRSNVKQLEKEIDRLLEERETLQNRLGRGDYNPATTKVLHFAYTPEVMRQDQQNQTEMERLKEKIRSLDEELAVLKSNPSGGSSSSSSSSSSLAEAQQKFEQISSELRNLRQENSILKEQIKEKEYSNKRFTEVCMTRIKEFKDTCYQLFGWKIDFDDQSGRRYRLQSMFAKSGDEFLLFQYSKKQLMLYETEFSKSIDASISGYLTQFGSIPSFLSSLSLALFERSRKK